MPRADAAPGMRLALKGTCTPLIGACAGGVFVDTQHPRQPGGSPRPMPRFARRSGAGAGGEGSVAEPVVEEPDERPGAL